MTRHDRLLIALILYGIVSSAQLAVLVLLTGGMRLLAIVGEFLRKTHTDEDW